MSSPARGAACHFSTRPLSLRSSRNRQVAARSRDSAATPVPIPHTPSRRAVASGVLTADEARAWLADAGLRAAEQPDFTEDLQLARDVRKSLCAMIAHNTDGRPLTEAELRPLEQVTSQARPRLEVTAAGRVGLRTGTPAQRLADGLAGMLLTIRDTQADGSWDRMKLCGNPDCLWAFYDRSHSRRGAWCEMASCGNRLKNRNLRARRARAG